MLVVLERHLDHAGGHEATQIAAIDRLSGGRELLIIACRTEETEANDAGPKESRLRRLLSPLREKSPDPAAKLAFDAKALGAFFKDRQEGDVLLVPSATRYDIELVLLALESGHLPQSIYLRLLVARQFATLPPPKQQKLRELTKSGRINLVTEAASFSSYLEKEHDLPSDHVLVLPCMIEPGFVSGHSGNEGLLRVGFLGRGRREKGWHDLPDIIGATARQLRRNEFRAKIEFVVPRKQRPAWDPLNALRSARLHVKASRPGMGCSGVRVVRSPVVLPEDEFVSHLDSLDVVIVPYRLPDYAHRGSGIVLDSVLAGKPVVYTQGIGMMDYLSFGNAVGARTPAEFASGILSILRSPDSLRAGCRRAKAFAEAKFEETGSFLRSI